MTDIDYAGLREKAEKATLGPWPIIGGNEYIANVGILVGSPEGIEHADAEFIAAADPQTVLALLDEIERLGNELAEAHTHFAIQEGRIEQFKRERDETLAVIERIGAMAENDDAAAWDAHQELIRLVARSTPADALREHDATLIEELAEEIVFIESEMDLPDDFLLGLDTGVEAVYAALRKKARERREGVS